MAGVGSTYGSGSYMDKYFDVTGEDTLASGLKTYETGAGFRDARSLGNGHVVATLNL